MSDNIVQFPTETIRSWTIIERAMKEELIRLGISEPVRERLIEKMKPFYELLNVKFEFNTSIDLPPVLSPAHRDSIVSKVTADLTKSISEQVHAFTNAIFFERFKRELEFCTELGLLG